MVDIFLHPVKSKHTIASVYRKALNEAEEIYILSAYLRSWDVLLPCKEYKTFNFVVGSDFGITRRQACEDVLSWLPSQLKPFFFIAEDISGFHPKGLFWRNSRNKCFALIGSSNLSDAGWQSNFEANTLSAISNNQFSAVEEWVSRVLEKSAVITPRWIQDYEEAPVSKRKKHKASTLERPTTILELPDPSGYSKEIRRRRELKNAFRKIRRRLELAINDCASGRLSDSSFYSELMATWNEHSRVQGWGWEVTGRKSKFRPLCKGLREILNDSSANRDMTVVRVIDNLKSQSVPTRRSLLSELLCQFFPRDYPVLNGPVAEYVKSRLKPARGMSEGAKYIFLAQALRAALRKQPTYPAKDLFELDGVIWASGNRILMNFKRGPHAANHRLAKPRSNSRSVY